MSIKKAKLNHEKEHPLIVELKKHNQEHLIPFITSDIENNPIAQQLQTFSLESTLSYLKEAQKVKDSIPDELIQPVSTVKLNEIDTDKYKIIGEEAIRNGEVAAVILSGGQGTRLGHNGPKGTLNHVTYYTLSYSFNHHILCTCVYTAYRYVRVTSALQKDYLSTTYRAYPRLKKTTIIYKLKK